MSDLLDVENDTFGIEVTYTQQAGHSFQITGILESPRQEEENRLASSMVFKVKQSAWPIAIPPAPQAPTPGDRIDIPNGVTVKAYKVVESIDDADGQDKLILRRT